MNINAEELLRLFMSYIDEHNFENECFKFGQIMHNSNNPQDDVSLQLYEETNDGKYVRKFNVKISKINEINC